MRKILNEELNRLSVKEFRAVCKRRIVLVLDNIRSMHNVGSAFRTADAFAIEKIVLCGFTACPPHREIQKSALGATESVAWEHVSETSSAVQRLRVEGYKVFAVEQVEGAVSLEKFIALVSDSKLKDADGTMSLDKSIESEGLALVFGNELDGVQQEIVNICDGAIEIPQWGTKHSFNVSVSIGIVLWELVRQRIRIWRSGNF
jgi:tRNA G18 (ribose-2'-O)-methylase SpoU